MTETVGKRYTWQSMRKEKGYASYFKSVTSPPSQGECFHALLDRCPNHAPTRPGHTFRVLFQCVGLTLYSTTSSSYKVLPKSCSLAMSSCWGCLRSCRPP